MIDLPWIVELTESGKWPTPEHIEELAIECERSRRFFDEYPELKGPPDGFDRRKWLRSLRPDQVRILDDWTTHGQLLVRILHSLGALANLSVEETAALLGGYPTAWSRIRAVAMIASNATQELQPAAKSLDAETDKTFTHRPWPGSKEWHNWGIGRDEHGNWHLFHFQRWGDANAVYRWARHSHATVKIVPGAMAEVASRFMENGVLGVTDDSEGPVRNIVSNGESRYHPTFPSHGG